MKTFSFWNYSIFFFSLCIIHRNRRSDSLPCSSFRCIYSIFVMHTHTKTVVFVCHALVWWLLEMQLSYRRVRVAHTSWRRIKLNNVFSCLQFNWIHSNSCVRVLLRSFLSHKIKLSGIDSAVFIGFLLFLWHDYCNTNGMLTTEFRALYTRTNFCINL